MGLCVSEAAVALACHCSIMPHWLMSCYARVLFLSAPSQTCHNMSQRGPKCGGCVFGVGGGGCPLPLDQSVIRHISQIFSHVWSHIWSREKERSAGGGDMLMKAGWWQMEAGIELENWTNWEAKELKSHFLSGLESGACSVLMFVIAPSLRCYCSASQQAWHRLTHGHLSYGAIQWPGCSCSVDTSLCFFVLLSVSQLCSPSLRCSNVLPLFCFCLSLSHSSSHCISYTLSPTFSLASSLVSLPLSLILTPPFHISLTYSSCYP